MWKVSAECFLQNADYWNTVLVAAFSVVLSLMVYKAWRSSTCKKREVPGKLGLPYLGETLAFLSATNSTKGCYAFVRKRRQWYGRWFKTRLFGKIHIYIPSPEGAKTVLTNDFIKFNKGYVKSMGDAVGKKSLLTVPHESHRRIRRLLSDPFSMSSLPKFVQKLDMMLLERLKSVEEKGGSFAALDFCMKVTFDAMCDMLISVTDAKPLQDIEQKCNDVSNMMLSFPAMIPGSRYYKGMKARKQLMQIFSEMIARRRSGMECHDDFLQAMLRRDSLPEDEKLSDEEIMDNLLTLIIAGQSTTAAAMMWSVKFLDGNGRAQERLRVVKETLRMSNVLLWFPRVVVENCVMEGFELKKGWHVNVDATHIHYDPLFYKDPLEFDPSRFDEMQKPYTFIPFGSGVRTCLGINMAKVTMLAFLHRLTCSYRWKVDDMDPSLEKRAHIPRLRSGCPITLIPVKNVEDM
ncbi:abscisic acid 8'-hydroxylase 3-like [Cocos nucifera]|uniref:Abscisic acid 8'-hydroxylase 3-like n=1 Tax=Cocos nucifera TaxID=13894 RepID=A0A8K0I9D8_COCNU|nr:abscisic acid 8'-hydroxylase 3-like [Cocos nucifera]